MSDPVANINIPDSAWEETGGGDDPGARLLCQLTINGHPFHCEAYAVMPDYHGCYVAADPIFNTEIEGLYALGFQDAAFTTQMIRGRECVVAIYPHGD